MSFLDVEFSRKLILHKKLQHSFIGDQANVCRDSGWWTT